MGKVLKSMILAASATVAGRPTTSLAAGASALAELAAAATAGGADGSCAACFALGGVVFAFAGASFSVTACTQPDMARSDPQMDNSEYDRIEFSVDEQIGSQIPNCRSTK